MRVRRAAVPSDFHPVLARMFAEVAGSNGKGASGRARETSKGKTAGGCVHPTFVCEAENESRLKEGTQRSSGWNFTTSVATADTDGATNTYACISDAPSAKDHPSFLRIN